MSQSALAATGFATLWTTVLYGTMAYPNLWLAFALQQAVLGPVHTRVARAGAVHNSQAAFLRAEAHLRPPCLVVGEGAIQQGYLRACSSRWLPDQAPKETDRRLADASSVGTPWSFG